MRGKLLFVTGIAVGYVLGARAGRQRYEQIKSAAESLWNTPAVQKGVDSAKDYTLSRVGDVSDNVLDGVKKLIKAATNAQKASGPSTGPSRPARMAAKSTVIPTATGPTALVPDPEDPAGPAPKSGPSAGKTPVASDPE